jgi:two-component system, NtrC family, sensor kinase
VRGESFVHIADASDDEGYRLGNPVRRAPVDAAGARTYLAVPLRRDEILLGSFTIYRREIRPFTGELVALLQNFAAQAVIAIQNARLFNETYEALARQTATAEILKVIARSPSDVQPVFDAIATSAKLLIGGVSAAVFRFIAGARHLAAFTPTNPEADEAIKGSFPRSLDDYSFFDSVRDGNALKIIDTEAETLAGIRDMARLRNYGSMLFVPLMNQGTSIGMIGVSRKEPGTFAEDDVQLLRTFADQAVIAIENARLFNEVQARTKELAASLDELRTAQDRLVQTEKLASLGQLTAGIAHEIKNPLNFVNNFSALSAELVEEMKDVLSDIHLDKNKRDELDEITKLLRSNLEKVVQHGKRADSIVKNMLQHSVKVPASIVLPRLTRYLTRA